MDGCIVCKGVKLGLGGFPGRWHDGANYTPGGPLYTAARMDLSGLEFLHAFTPATRGVAAP
ncbi:hypothetical protein QF000_002733 [Paraburkholderia atlantica]